MSRTNNLILLDYKKKEKAKQLSDRDRICFAWHYISEGELDRAIKIMAPIQDYYWATQIHKDIGRALLCHEAYKSTRDSNMGKESEFYIVIYRLTKYISDTKVQFKNASQFWLLRDQLFKDLM